MVVRGGCACLIRSRRNFGIHQCRGQE